MENNKQSSVDWLFQKLWDEPKDKFTWYAILKQAKQMEKKQMIEFAENVVFERLNESIYAPFNIEQYYNETYNK